MNIAERVALALAKANPSAGAGYTEEGETVEQRAENLIRCGYVVEGDPGEWCDGDSLATIYMEPNGGAGDCMVPLDYWDRGMEHSFKASNYLGDCYIEFVNAATAAVHTS